VAPFAKLTKDMGGKNAVSKRGAHFRAGASNSRAYMAR
jgi:hypothetical protein